MNPLQNVPLSNTWMFSEVMNDSDIRKAILEEILPIRIKRLEYAYKQDITTSRYVSQGIQMDVYAADKHETLYNAGIQMVNEPNVERRIRYFQALIDSRMIECGVYYAVMPESYIIFICTFDHYGDGFPVYKRESYIPRGGQRYDDGTHVILLNTKYNKTDEQLCRVASPALLEFLDIVEAGSELDPRTFSTPLGKAVAERIIDIRYDKRKEDYFLSFERALRDARKEARREVTIKCVKALMKNRKITAEEALDHLKVDEHDRDFVLWYLKNEDNPKVIGHPIV